MADSGLFAVVEREPKRIAESGQGPLGCISFGRFESNFVGLANSWGIGFARS